MTEIIDKPKRRRHFFVIVAAFALVALFVVIFFYRENIKRKQNPLSVEQDTGKSIIDQVSKLVVLPEGEEPTIATVTDPEILKSQVFFTHAQTGDRVLIYTKARKAILYSPSLNKIVEIAPLNIGSESKN
ncbi:MAG: hypothetical protein G01um101448_1009 [Parcubacteria group bacterium Gr01-1014_48]|nr:MAG: hypothetical protein Greene041614_336 [Parcubacteria group bacterium Greene0416_14]TSC72261.1 MAG: hypothetical protein G01um101448_1009 [Parcubacteria group bacterium Gr01-1014_48]TSD00001.1 MAG: hypothetical protein Greene101415_1004 [Parcubacteria group bacterium Greene1014_15]TSD07231.1 MAG: hypothetical protein Greene07144_956 [Parcubacteria group bacterium Greene0714_4]